MNPVCLDFHNTVDWTSGALDGERLDSYAHLVDWAARAGLLGDASRARLLEWADSDPGTARCFLASAHDLRQSIHHVFSAITAGRRPTSRDTARFNRFVHESLCAAFLEVGARGGRWWWNGAASLGGFLHRIAFDAAALLASDRIRRLRCCENAACGRLFLDESRSRTRRWCNKRVCGPMSAVHGSSDIVELRSYAARAR
jgi:predicted RNA-binding Zn ribbon-like protein